MVAGALRQGPVKMTLEKGDTVDFSINLLPVAKSTPKKEKFVPKKFLVTPPNETSTSP